MPLSIVLDWIYRLVMSAPFILTVIYFYLMICTMLEGNRRWMGYMQHFLYGVGCLYFYRLARIFLGRAGMFLAYRELPRWVSKGVISVLILGCVYVIVADKPSILDKIKVLCLLPCIPIAIIVLLIIFGGW